MKERDYLLKRKKGQHKIVFLSIAGLLIFAVCIFFIYIKLPSIIKTKVQTQPTSTNGYVYPYPEYQMKDPVIAINPGSGKCSPEYVKDPTTYEYQDPANNTQNEYYIGSGVSADVWEKDAYVIASVVSYNLSNNSLNASGDIFASSCSPHYLFSLTDDLTRGPHSELIFTHPSPIVNLSAPNLTVNVAQLPFNIALIQPNTTHYDTAPSFAMPKYNGTPLSYIVAGHAIQADILTIQTNRSEKYGLLYQSIYIYKGKLVAIASYKEDGSLLTFTVK